MSLNALRKPHANMLSTLMLVHCLCIFVMSSLITCAYLQAVATGCKPPPWQYLTLLTGRLVYDIVANPLDVRVQTVLPLLLAIESVLVIWCMRRRSAYVGEPTGMHKLPFLCLCADLMYVPAALWPTPGAACAR